MATLEIPSNVKCITSGQVPTTANLKDGEFAFGKVGGVAKLYGNVNGVIIDFTGDSATIDANTLLALLSASNGIAIAKNTAGDKVEVGISRSGFELGTFSTDMTGIEFVCSDTTQTINFISPDGDGLLICNMMDSTRSSIILLGSSGEGTMIAYNDMTYTPDSSSSEVKHYLREGNVKTLFGNQSIYGSGNIDLYRHNIEINVKQSGERIAWLNTILISSSNVKISSLPDFFSAFSNLGYAYPFMGFAPDANGLNQSVTVVEPRSSGGVAFAGSAQGFQWSDLSLNFAIDDTVTTV